MSENIWLLPWQPWHWKFSLLTLWDYCILKAWFALINDHEKEILYLCKISTEFNKKVIEFGECKTMHGGTWVWLPSNQTFLLPRRTDISRTLYHNYNSYNGNKSANRNPCNYRSVFILLISTDKLLIECVNNDESIFKNSCSLSINLNIMAISAKKNI